MNQLTNRQEKYLLLIVKDYIASGIPVGSKHLIAKYHVQASSATIRNEMAQLEDWGFLEKTHTSSGRIPSSRGFLLYARSIENNNVERELKQKLKALFVKRHLQIDQVVDEAAKTIALITDLTLVTHEGELQELLKSIQFVPLKPKRATIILVTSSGKVNSKLIQVQNALELEDVRIAVRVFKDRLIDTELSKLAEKARALIPILRAEIKNYEFILQEMITQVFQFEPAKHNHVYGRTNIIKQRNFSDPKKLLKVMEFLEKESIWESIEGNNHDDETLRIEIDADSALVSKRISYDNTSKEISIVGSNRMEYGKVIPILAYLEKLIKEKIN